MNLLAILTVLRVEYLIGNIMYYFTFHHQLWLTWIMLLVIKKHELCCLSSFCQLAFILKCKNKCECAARSIMLDFRYTHIHKQIALHLALVWCRLYSDICCASIIFSKGRTHFKLCKLAMYTCASIGHGHEVSDAVTSRKLIGCLFVWLH